VRYYRKSEISLPFFKQVHKRVEMMASCCFIHNLVILSAKATTIISLFQGKVF